MALKSVGSQNVIYGTSPPNTGMLGQLWMDTSSNPGVLNECISLSPLTYAPVTGGGGGGAPTTATYVTLSLDAGLSAERVLTAGTGISIIDGGPNTTVTINATGTGTSAPTYIMMGDGNDGEDAYPIPGPTGATGQAGQAGTSIQGPSGPPGQEQDPGEDSIFILEKITTFQPVPSYVFIAADDPIEPDPAPPGTQGIQGIQGTPGSSGTNSTSYIFIAAEDPIEPDFAPPGAKGDTGATGTPGSGSGGSPVYIFSDADPGEDGIPMVGATGAQGPAGGGGGGGSYTEVELDFGTTPRWDATFTITDATVINSTYKVMISESGKAATGRVAGDSQWDSVAITAAAGAGNFTAYCTVKPGPIVGKRKFLYQVAA